MNFLLSSGKSTSDIIVYASDLIYLDMFLLTNEIPYSNLGSDELISGIAQNEVENNIKEIVDKIISDVKTELGINIELSNVVFNQSFVTVNIKIEDKTMSYDIKRSNS
jgi:hypothetical protein